MGHIQSVMAASSGRPYHSEIPWTPHRTLLVKETLDLSLQAGCHKNIPKFISLADPAPNQAKAQDLLHCLRAFYVSLPPSHHHYNKVLQDELCPCARYYPR